MRELNADRESREENALNITLDDEISTTQVEVLDLTHHHDNPFKVHFDDVSWSKHITNLKPLGLSILLNTCNLDTQVNNI